MRRRVEMLRQGGPDKFDWAGEGLFTTLAEDRLEGGPPFTKEGLIAHLLDDWLGLEKEAGGWVQKDTVHDSAQPELSKTTGYWTAYRGNVTEILRRSLLWTFELALGLEPGQQGRGRCFPFKIDVLLKCPSPWFEAWVVCRPIRVPVIRRGSITLILTTPSYRGSNVVESCLARHPKVRVPGIRFAVPSYEDDYEVLEEPLPLGALQGRPRVPASRRRHAMWLVTHEDHVQTGTIRVTKDSTETADFWDWGIPQVSIYHGTGEVVVVSPSMPFGGVRHDGSV